MNLSDLLARSRTQRADASAALAASERLRRPLEEKEAEALRSAISAFREKYRWTPTAQVALIARQFCSCGATHQWCEGLFLRSRHVSDSHAFRLVAAAQGDASLPKEVEYQDSHVHLCPSCASSQGFGQGATLELPLEIQ